MADRKCFSCGDQEIAAGKAFSVYVWADGEQRRRLICEKCKKSMSWRRVCLPSFDLLVAKPRRKRATAEVVEAPLEKLAHFCVICGHADGAARTDRDAVADGWQITLYRAANGDPARRMCCPSCTVNA